MPNYKDTNNKVHFLDDAAFDHLLPAGCVPIADEEAAELCAPVQTLSAELASLASAYKTELTSLQMSWLAASVNGGPTLAGKQAAIQSDMADTKAQYLLDVADTKARYA